MAARLGLEPRHTAPKTGVLPLDDRATRDILPALPSARMDSR